MTVLYGIDKIIDNYEAVILDTSIMKPLDKKTDKMFDRSITKLTELCREVDNIYISKGVSGEFLPENLPYLIEISKPIAQNLGKDSNWNKSLFKKINKKYKRVEKKQRTFLEIFQSKGNIIDFSNEERYKLIDKSCRRMKKHYKLSDVDWDFLISGIIFSEQVVPVCLVSNDFGILNAYKKFAEISLFKKGSLDFFLRPSFDSYELGELRR